MSHIREEKGIQIITTGRIRRIDKTTYNVASQPNSKVYKVEWSRNKWKCECPDYQQNNMKCKHIHAVTYFQTINSIKNGLQNHKKQDICPICKTRKDVIKRGMRNNQSGQVQLYYCKKCRKRFTGRPGFKKMKHNASIIAASLDLYYRGLSLRQITEHLEVTYNTNVSYGTIYNWIRKYVTLISEHMEKLTISASDR